MEKQVETKWKPGLFGELPPSDINTSLNGECSQCVIVYQMHCLTLGCILGCDGFKQFRP